MGAVHGAESGWEQVLQELAQEITDPVQNWRAVASWRSRALATLNRALGTGSTWSQEFATLADDLVLPAPSLAEDWDVHEYEQRFCQAIGLLQAAAEEVQGRYRDSDSGHPISEKEGALPLNCPRVSYDRAPGDTGELQFDEKTVCENTPTPPLGPPTVGGLIVPAGSGLDLGSANLQVQGERRTWVEKFRPALRLALDEFFATAEWPERERFRRRLVQRGLDDLNLDELLHYMPKSPWESQQFPPDRIVLTLQVLQELQEAQDLLEVCIAITQRAYALYRDEDEDDPVLSSDDPVLIAAAGGDARLLLCAREVLRQHPPGPLGGGTAGTEATAWTRTLNQAAIPAFKNIGSIDDYLTAQERLIGNDPHRRSWRPPLPAHPFVGSAAPGTRPAATETATDRMELFVIMPFRAAWSAGVYAFIRRTTERLRVPKGSLRLYRADEIAEPGQITQQIKDSIATARVVIADITGVNPNVMWELGYADGLGKPIVVLNQDPDSSPFDMADRRQVAYHASPTEQDEDNLLRHIIQVLQAQN